MTPTDWLQLAEELCSDSREIAHRASASRAYYAAFWHCRAMVQERFGPVDAVGPEVHAALANAVELWDSVVAENLRHLRFARN